MTDTLEHLAGRVWLFPLDPDADNIRGCVAVISDPTGSIVVDAGHSPAVARRVQDAITESGLPSARTLVYTHHHWDHTWGACAWEGVETIGHASGTALLEAEARRPWSHAYLRSEVEANPLLEPSFSARARAMPTWAGFEIVPPQRTFTDSLDLPNGVRLSHVGGRHAEDSIVIEVPDSGVLLLGDCYYPPPYHLRGPADDYDGDMVRRLLSDRFEWYVDSHSNPHSRDEVAALLGS